MQTRVVAGFRCAGDRCVDTCCKGWGMQLSRETIAQYRAEAPELLDAVTSGEADFIMKRDPVTDYCVKFEQGWCGIHAAYGERMLGDACYFFPRVTRSLGGKTLMTASMGCPVVAEAVLTMDAPCDTVEGAAERLPYSLKEYGTDTLAGEAVQKIHEAFLLHARAESRTAERSLVEIGSVVRSLMRLPIGQWEAATPFYLRMAEGRLPVPEAAAGDPFHVLNALQGLVAMAPPAERLRLMQSIECASSVLQVALDWQDLGIEVGEQSQLQYLRMVAFWNTHCAAHYAPMLRRWLEGQLSLGLFPFAGLGETMEQRATVLAARMATLKLLLMAECFAAQDVLALDESVRVVQGLSRFMDHLADVTLSMKIYEEVGWVREARARGLLGDA